jgi:hypothetical protein
MRYGALHVWLPRLACTASHSRESMNGLLTVLRSPLHLSGAVIRGACSLALSGDRKLQSPRDGLDHVMRNTTRQASAPVSEPLGHLWPEGGATIWHVDVATASRLLGAVDCLLMDLDTGGVQRLRWRQ